MVIQVAASVATTDGGPSTAVLSINRALRSMHRRATVVTTTAAGPTARLVRDTTVPQDVDGARVWFCERSRPHLLKHSWQLAARAEQCAAGAGVVHVHGVYLANSMWAARAARRRAVPYVIQPHGAFEPYQEARHRLRKWLFNALVGNRIVAGAGALIAASEAEAVNLRQRWPGTEVAVVPLGFSDPQPCAPGDRGRFAAWLAQPRERRVVFLGRLARKKRPELLLEAWGAAPRDAHLLVVGPDGDWTPTSLRERLRATAVTGGLNPERADATVTFSGALPAAEVAWVLDQAGIFVLPSENENFGIAVVEAMGHGCAVVTTQQTAAGDHVQTAGAGVVLPRPDAGLLAEQLDTLLASAELVRRWGHQGRSHARAHLTWAATARSLAAVYDRLAAGDDAPRADAGAGAAPTTIDLDALEGGRRP